MLKISKKHGEKNKAAVNSKISILKTFHTCEIAQNLHRSRQKMYDSAAEKLQRSQNITILLMPDYYLAICSTYLVTNVRQHISEISVA